MSDRKCDNCQHRGPWRVAYSKVPIGPQAFAVADCPHAYPGTAVTPGSGTHCSKFSPRAAIGASMAGAAEGGGNG